MATSDNTNKSNYCGSHQAIKSRVDEEIDEIVAEYLEHRQFINTLDCFRSESRQHKLRRDRLARSDEDLLRRARGGESSVSNKTSASEDKTPADGLGNREAGLHFPRSYALLEAFDAGDMLGFLSAWAALVPRPLLRRLASLPLARELRVAEFLSCVHFAVLPFRASSLEKAAGPRDASIACARSMSAFRRYLDTRARGWADDRELADFYTLPHVADPPSNSAFADVFEDSWPAALRSRVEDVIGKVDRWRPEEPLLVKLVRDRNSKKEEKKNDEKMHDASRGKDIPTSERAVGDGGYQSHRHHRHHRHHHHDHLHHGRHRRGSETSNTSTDTDDDVDDLNNPQNKPELGRGRASRGTAATDPHQQHRQQCFGTTRGDRDSEGTNDGGASGLVEASQKGRRWPKSRPRLLRSGSERAILGRVDYQAIKRDLRTLAEEVAGGSSEGGSPRPHSAEGRTKHGRGLPHDLERRSSSAVDAALVLQALRWRFSHAPPGKIRRGVLYHLIRHDIFDLRLKPGGGAGDERAKTAKGAGGDRSASVLELLLRLSVGADDKLKQPDGKNAAQYGTTNNAGKLNAGYAKQPHGKIAEEVDGKKAKQSDEKSAEQSGESVKTTSTEGDDSSDQSSESGLKGGSACGVATGGGDLSEARLKSGWEEFDGKPGRLVAEYAVRLVGVLASMSKARSYILGQSGEATIGVLVVTLKGEEFRETALAKGLLGVLSRLSKQRSAQEVIARSGFVDWAAKMLGSQPLQGATSQDPYPLFLRRTTTVLESVVRADPGRAVPVSVATDLLSSLANLLEHKNDQVRSNAIRVLRAMLAGGAGEKAREQALATGMDALLQDLRSRKSKSNSGSDNDSAFLRDVESLLELLTGKRAFSEDEGDDGGGGSIHCRSRGRRSRSSSSDQKRHHRHQHHHHHHHLNKGVNVKNNGGINKNINNDDDGDDDGGAAEDADVEDADYLSDDDPEEAFVVSRFVESTNAPCGEELLRQRYRLSTAEAKEEILASGTSWGGEEEELVCGGGGGYANRRPKRNGVGESKGESDSPRMPTPEAGTATVIRGEEKVYDRRRPGLPEEMQSRPMIPRTPTVAVLAVAMEKSNMGVKVERDVCPR